MCVLGRPFFLLGGMMNISRKTSQEGTEVVELRGDDKMSVNDSGDEKRTTDSEIFFFSDISVTTNPHPDDM